MRFASFGTRLANQDDTSRFAGAAYAALKQTAPNGRDYYPQGPDALSAATDEHLDRLRRLDAIKSEIDDLAGAIYDA